MKIILVNRFFYPDESATSQLLSDLAFALSESGHEVVAISSSQSYSASSVKFPAFEIVRGVQIHRVGLTSFGRAGPLRILDYASFMCAALGVVLRSCKEGDVLVAKTDPPLLSVPMLAIALLRGAVLVNWVQDVFPEVAAKLGVPGIRGPVFGSLRTLRNWSLRNAHTNVVIGKRMRLFLTSSDVSPQRIQVIHNWSDGERIKPLEPQSNSLRKDWGLSEKLVVGYSGNMGRAHGFDTLLEAMRRLANDPRIHFLFIGEGRQLSAIREFVDANSLRNVTLQPYQPRERLGLSLTAADLHVVTLKPELEGLIVPSKVYGALAAGVPVLFIGDPEGEVPSMMSESDRWGFAVQESDVDSAVQAILELANNHELRSRMGVAARHAFESKYSKSIAIDTWIRTLKEVASRKTSPH